MNPPPALDGATTHHLYHFYVQWMCYYQRYGAMLAGLDDLPLSLLQRLFAPAGPASLSTESALPGLLSDSRTLYFPTTMRWRDFLQVLTARCSAYAPPLS